MSSIHSALSFFPFHVGEKEKKDAEEKKKQDIEDDIAREYEKVKDCKTRM